MRRVGVADVSTFRLPTPFSGKSASRVSRWRKFEEVTVRTRRALLESRREPGARRLPVALDRNDRYLQRFSDVLFAQSAEEPQLHHSSRARVSLFQLRQERVQIEQLFDRKCGDPAYVLRERHAPLFTASLFGNSG